MLVVANSRKKSCGCRGGLGFARRGSRGLGDALAYLPAGTQLVYNVSVAPGLFMGPLTSLAKIVSQVAQNVGRNAGISIIGSNASTNPFTTQTTITVSVQIEQEYTDQQMVQSVLDSAFNATSVNVSSSNIAATSVPGSAGGSVLPGLNTAPTQQTLAAAPGTATTSAGGAGWLDQDSLGFGLSNGTYLTIGGIGLLGLALVKKII